MTLTVTRRAALIGGPLVALAGCSRRQEIPLPLPEGSFKHGVASGDSDQTSVVVWTAVTGMKPGAAVTLEFSVEKSFARPLTIEVAPAGPVVEGSFGRSTPHKHIVTGLEPGRVYFYRFVHDGERSPAGRTRTLPSGAVERWRIAVFSCSNLPAGYFNAYRDAATLEDLDQVLHLGDYIYEGGMGGYGTRNATQLARQPEPIHEAISAHDYALRHAQYCLDPDLQALKAHAPWIVLWDDHDIANNAWRAGADNHEGSERSWLERRDAALDAFYQWLPMRRPKPACARYGVIQIGDLATLIYMETRLLARSEKINYDTFPVPPDSDVDRPDVRTAVAQWRDNVVGDPGRELLGQKQLTFVSHELARSKREGKAWRILANQVLMGPIVAPDFSKTLPVWMRWPMALVGGAKYDAILRSRFGVPFTTDSWDGFPAERGRLYGLAREAGADFIVLSGDSHSHWCIDLKDELGERRGVEFGVTAVSSPSHYEAAGVSGVDFGKMFTDANADVLHHRPHGNGYVRFTLTPQSVDVEMMVVSTVLERTFSVRIDSHWRCRPAVGKSVLPVERLSEAPPSGA